MTYNPNIPQPTDRPSDSQSQILNNFAALNTIFNSDHITFTAAEDNGEHKKVTLNDVLAGDPGLPDPKASLYTKAISGDAELFFEKFANGPAANLISQLTNLPITSGAKHGGTQYTWLSPWGMRFTAGVTSFFSGNSVDTYLVPFNTVVYTALATPNDTFAHRCAAQTNLTTLTLRTISSSTSSMYYLVIGD